MTWIMSAQIRVADPRCAGDFRGSECCRESGLHRLGQLERNADRRGAVHHHGDGPDRRRHVGRWRGRFVGRTARGPCERADRFGARSSRVDRPVLDRRRHPACWRRFGSFERNHGGGGPRAADHRDAWHVSRLPGDYARDDANGGRPGAGLAGVRSPTAGAASLECSSCLSP